MVAAVATPLGAGLRHPRCPSFVGRALDLGGAAAIDPAQHEHAALVADFEPGSPRSSQWPVEDVQPAGLHQGNGGDHGSAVVQVAAAASSFHDMCRPARSSSAVEQHVAAFDPHFAKPEAGERVVDDLSGLEQFCCARCRASARHRRRADSSGSLHAASKAAACRCPGPSAGRRVETTLLPSRTLARSSTVRRPWSRPTVRSARTDFLMNGGFDEDIGHLLPAGTRGRCRPPADRVPLLDLVGGRDRRCPPDRVGNVVPGGKRPEALCT